MSSTTPTTTQIRLLQSSIPLLAAFTTGISLSYSTVLVPRLLQSPTPLMLRQWLSSFNTGRKGIPPLSILSTSGYFFLAYHFSGRGRLGRGYLLAGLLSISPIPYTRVFMWSGITQLRKKAEEMSSWGVVEGGDEAKVVKEEDHVQVDVLEEEGAKALVDFWGVLNVGRAVLLGASSLLGVGLAF